jgi:hypothetical protein
LGTDRGNDVDLSVMASPLTCGRVRTKLVYSFSGVPYSDAKVILREANSTDQRILKASADDDVMRAGFSFALFFRCVNTTVE